MKKLNKEEAHILYQRVEKYLRLTWMSNNQFAKQLEIDLKSFTNTLRAIHSKNSKFPTIVFADKVAKVIGCETTMLINSGISWEMFLAHVVQRISTLKFALNNKILSHDNAYISSFTDKVIRKAQTYYPGKTLQELSKVSGISISRLYYAFNLQKSVLSLSDIQNLSMLLKIPEIKFYEYALPNVDRKKLSFHIPEHEQYAKLKILQRGLRRQLKALASMFPQENWNIQTLARKANMSEAHLNALLLDSSSNVGVGSLLKEGLQLGTIDKKTLGREYAKLFKILGVDGEQVSQLGQLQVPKGKETAANRHFEFWQVIESHLHHHPEISSQWTFIFSPEEKRLCELALNVNNPDRGRIIPTAQIVDKIVHFFELNIDLLNKEIDLKFKNKNQNEFFMQQSETNFIINKNPTLKDSLKQDFNLLEVRIADMPRLRLIDQSNIDYCLHLLSRRPIVSELLINSIILYRDNHLVNCLVINHDMEIIHWSLNNYPESIKIIKNFYWPKGMNLYNHKDDGSHQLIQFIKNNFDRTLLSDKQVNSILARQEIVLFRFDENNYKIGFAKEDDVLIKYCEERLDLVNHDHFELIDYLRNEHFFAECLDDTSLLKIRSSLDKVITSFGGRVLSFDSNIQDVVHLHQKLVDTVFLHGFTDTVVLNFIEELIISEFHNMDIIEKLLPNSLESYQALATSLPGNFKDASNKSEIIKSFLSSISIPYEETDLPGICVSHGTLENQRENVKSGPKNLGKGFGGEGLYVALQGEKTVADEYAEHAKKMTNQKSCTMQGHLTKNKLRMGSIVIAKRFHAGDITKGIFPADWAKNKPLQALIHRYFDLIEVKGAASAGYAMSSDRFLVLHESSGAAAINWNITLETTDSKAAPIEIKINSVANYLIAAQNPSKIENSEKNALPSKISDEKNNSSNYTDHCYKKPSVRDKPLVLSNSEKKIVRTNTKLPTSLNKCNADEFKIGVLGIEAPLHGKNLLRGRVEVSTKAKYITTQNNGVEVVEWLTKPKIKISYELPGSSIETKTFRAGHKALFWLNVAMQVIDGSLKYSNDPNCTIPKLLYQASYDFEKGSAHAATLFLCLPNPLAWGIVGKDMVLSAISIADQLFCKFSPDRRPIFTKKVTDFMALDAYLEEKRIELYGQLPQFKKNFGQKYSDQVVEDAFEIMVVLPELEIAAKEFKFQIAANEFEVELKRAEKNYSLKDKPESSSQKHATVFEHNLKEHLQQTLRDQFNPANNKKYKDALMSDVTYPLTAEEMDAIIHWKPDQKLPHHSQVPPIDPNRPLIVPIKSNSAKFIEALAQRFHFTLSLSDDGWHYHIRFDLLKAPNPPQNPTEKSESSSLINTISQSLNLAVGVTEGGWYFGFALNLLAKPHPVAIAITVATALAALGFHRLKKLSTYRQEGMQKAYSEIEYKTKKLVDLVSPDKKAEIPKNWWEDGATCDQMLSLIKEINQELDSGYTRFLDKVKRHHDIKDIKVHELKQYGESCKDYVVHIEKLIHFAKQDFSTKEFLLKQKVNDSLYQDYCNIYCNQLLTKARAESEVDTQQAIALCNKILALQADHIDALAMRGQFYLSVKDYQAALKDLNYALQLRPDITELGKITLYAFVISLQTGSDKAKLKEQEQYALQLKNDHPTIGIYDKYCDLVASVSLFQEGKTKEAINLLNKHVKEHADSILHLYETFIVTKYAQFDSLCAQELVNEVKKFNATKAAAITKQCGAITDYLKGNSKFSSFGKLEAAFKQDPNNPYLATTYLSALCYQAQGYTQLEGNFISFLSAITQNNADENQIKKIIQIGITAHELSPDFFTKYYFLKNYSTGEAKKTLENFFNEKKANPSDLIQTGVHLIQKTGVVTLLNDADILSKKSTAAINDSLSVLDNALTGYHFITKENYKDPLSVYNLLIPLIIRLFEEEYKQRFKTLPDHLVYYYVKSPYFQQIVNSLNAYFNLYSKDFTLFCGAVTFASLAVLWSLIATDDWYVKRNIVRLKSAKNLLKSGHHQAALTWLEKIERSNFLGISDNESMKFKLLKAMIMSLTNQPEAVLQIISPQMIMEASDKIKRGMLKIFADTSISFFPDRDQNTLQLLSSHAELKDLHHFIALIFKRDGNQLAAAYHEFLSEDRSNHNNLPEDQVWSLLGIELMALYGKPLLWITRLAGLGMKLSAEPLRVLIRKLVKKMGDEVVNLPKNDRECVNNKNDFIKNSPKEAISSSVMQSMLARKSYLKLAEQHLILQAINCLNSNYTKNTVQPSSGIEILLKLIQSSTVNVQNLAKVLFAELRFLDGPFNEVTNPEALWLSKQSKDDFKKLTSIQQVIHKEMKIGAHKKHPIIRLFYLINQYLIGKLSPETIMNILKSEHSQSYQVVIQCSYKKQTFSGNLDLLQCYEYGMVAFLLSLISDQNSILRSNYINLISGCQFIPDYQQYLSLIMCKGIESKEIDIINSVCQLFNFNHLSDYFKIDLLVFIRNKCTDIVRPSQNYKELCSWFRQVIAKPSLDAKLRQTIIELVQWQHAFKDGFIYNGLTKSFVPYEELVREKTLSTREIKSLLAQGASPNQVLCYEHNRLNLWIFGDYQIGENKPFMYLLHRLAWCERSDLIALFRKYGADFSVLDFYDMNALEFYLASPDTLIINNNAVLVELLKGGIDPNQTKSTKYSSFNGMQKAKKGMGLIYYPYAFFRDKTPVGSLVGLATSSQYTGWTASEIVRHKKVNLPVIQQNLTKQTSMVNYQVEPNSSLHKLFLEFITDSDQQLIAYIFEICNSQYAPYELLVDAMQEMGIRKQQIENAFNRILDATTSEDKKAKIIHHSLAQYLLNIQDTNGNFPIHCAVKAGNYKLVAWMLEVDPNLVSVKNNDFKKPINVCTKEYLEAFSHLFKTYEKGIEEKIGPDREALQIDTKKNQGGSMTTRLPFFKTNSDRDSKVDDSIFASLHMNNGCQ